jgi:oligosaccharide repeat unit polymerase
VALLTLVSFLFGMHLAGWMRSAEPPVAWPQDARPIVRASWATWGLGTAMILVGIPIAGPEVLFGSYGDFKVAVKFAEADVRFFGTGFLIVQSGIFALIASADPQRPLRLRAALVSAVLLSLLAISIGTRLALMTIALGAGWAYTQHVRRVRTWVTATGFVLAFLVMPVIGEYREFRSVESTARLELGELAAANFYDMGSSLVAFSYTLEHIPRDKPYDWGLSVVSQLIDNIPNLGLSPGRFFGLDAVKHNPSKWLVATANPSKWQNFAGGYGYAVGAEWYFNFGMPGVLFGMAFLGFALNWLRNRSRTSPLWLTFTSLALIMGVGMVRNDFGYPFRQLFWPGAVLLIFVFLLPTRRAARRPAPGAAPP